MSVIRIITLSLVLFNVALAAQSRARQKFSCDDILNQQIQQELNAAQRYLAFSTHLGHDSIALEGFSKMFLHSWKEETEHAQKLIEYGLKRGANVVIPSIEVKILDLFYFSRNFIRRYAYF
jgi:ferritin